MGKKKRWRIFSYFNLGKASKNEIEAYDSPNYSTAATAGNSDSEYRIDFADGCALKKVDNNRIQLQVDYSDTEDNNQYYNPLIY